MSSFPALVLLDTTNVCNARCPFCPLFEGEWQIDRSTRPAAIMKSELYDKLLSEITTWDTLPTDIIHSANAEILQDPKVLERLNLLKQYGLGDRTTLLTNAQFLNETNAQAILSAKIKKLIIGFDGATKEVFEAHRVRCNYDRVLNNIRTFVRLRADAEFKTAIEIKFVRTKKNEHEVQAAYELFRSFLDLELDSFHDALAVDWSDDPAGEVGYYFVNKSKENRLKQCNYFENSIQIQSDGKVAACCWDYNLNISGGGLGNLNDVSIVDVWRGASRALLHEKFAADETTPEKCQSCTVLHEAPPATDDLMQIPSEHLDSRGPSSFLYRFGAVAGA